MKEQFEIWMVGTSRRWEPKAKPVVVCITVVRTEKQVKVLYPPHDNRDLYDLHHSVVGYRTLLRLDDPQLKHRTPEAAIEFWHKRNAEHIAELKVELAQLKALDAKTPQVKP